jgi:hypothetical protein
MIGYDHSTPTQFAAAAAVVQGAAGTVSVRTNNDITGTVTIHRNITANINGDGLLQPLGTGPVTLLGGTLNSDPTTSAQFGNTDFRLFGGSTFLLDNSNVLTDNTNRRLLPSSNVNLSSSTLRLVGEGATLVQSIQNIASLAYRGGSTVSIDTDGTAAGRLAAINTGTLERLDRGTLNIRNIANTGTATAASIFGTGARTQRLRITGTAPVITNGMMSANIALWGGTTVNDSASPQFVTYNATHGIQAASMVNAADAAALAASPNTQITGIEAIALAVTGAPSVQALRIRSTVNTNTVTGGTITIGAAAGVGQGAGLFLAHTPDNEIIHTSNFTFGGGQEGLIYIATPGRGQRNRAIEWQPQ